MSLKNTVKAIGLTFFDGADITADFLPINPNGLDHACFLVRINNDSTEAAIISYDGVNDHEFISSGEVIELPFQTNRGPVNQSAYLPQGTIIYVKEYTTAGTGNILLSGYYQPNN